MGVAVRMLAALLAVFVAAGIACSTAVASPDVASQVDDGLLEPEPAIAVAPVALALPARRALIQAVVLPPAPHGRLHLVSVFRPPRGFASR